MYRSTISRYIDYYISTFTKSHNLLHFQETNTFNVIRKVYLKLNYMYNNT